MKKIILIFVYITLIILVLINIYLFKKNIYLSKNNSSDKYFGKHTVSYSTKEIQYNKEYAIDVAIIIYKQLYKKDYSADAFCVKDDSRFGPLCWNVYLDPLKDNKPFNGVIDESPKGLIISKNNGAIVINLGD